MDPRMLIPLILFVGAVTSYEDAKYGKIRNKTILLILIIYAILCAVLLIFGPDSPSIYDLMKVQALNALVALFAGVMLWSMNLLSAAHAKLFAVFALLTPPQSPISPYLVPSDLLINLFIPLFSFFTIVILRKTSLFHKKWMLKAVLRGSLLFRLFAFSIVLSWILKSAVPLISPSFSLLLFLGFGILFRAITQTKSKLTIYAFCAVALLRPFLDGNFTTMASLGYFLISFILLLFVAFLRVSLWHGVFSRKVPIGELKEGMILQESVIKTQGRFEKAKSEGISKSHEGIVILARPSPQGLTKMELGGLKAHLKDFSFKTIRVEETLPFAPFIFSSALLYLLLQGNIVRYTMAALH